MRYSTRLQIVCGALFVVFIRERAAHTHSKAARRYVLAGSAILVPRYLAGVNLSRIEEA